MKKVLIVLGAIFGVLLIALLLVPILFKGKIQERVQTEINKSVNAEVKFDNLSVSFLKNFPDVTASLNDLSVVNKAPFEGDTLMSANELEIVLDLGSVIFSDRIRMEEVKVASPRLLIMMMEDGTANFDIAMEDTTSTAQDSGTGFTIDLKKYEVSNGHLVYYDQSLDLLMDMVGVNHSGSGNLTEVVYDLDTRTVIDSVTVTMEEIEYLTRKRIEADVLLNIDMEEERYTFKEGLLTINDFGIKVDGWLGFIPEGFNMDLAFSSPENTFKSLLSLVPGVYDSSFDDLQAEGVLTFDGKVAGVYSDSLQKLPATTFNLAVDQAMMKYPDLDPIRNISLDLLFEMAEDDLEGALVHLSNFSMEMNDKPATADIKVIGLGPMDVDADVQAHLDLEKLSGVIPMEGMSLRGKLDLDLKANGVYDSLKNQFPKIDGVFKLANGYVKTPDFPEPIENLNVSSRVINEDGSMAATVVDVDAFSFSLAGEPVTGKLHLENLENYRWDLALNGAIDLDKMTKIFPIEGMELAGRIKADINTSGQMSDVEAERYDRLRSSGNFAVSNFKYASDDLAHPFTIKEANGSLTPNRIVVSKMDAQTGQTDMSMTGTVSNYMSYLFQEGETLSADMNLTSNNVNLNEWMTEEEGAVEDTSALQPFEVPRNLNVNLTTSIANVIYDNLSLQNVRGGLVVRDGVVNMNDLTFNTLDGNFKIGGSYNTQDINNPLFDLDLDISNLAVSRAYSNFNTVQTLAPIAKKVNGNFSTNMNLSGALGQDMMPVFSNLTGNGVISIIEASIKDSKIISGITKLTKLNNTDNVNFKDLLMNVSIREGRVFVEPFDFQLLGNETVIAGSQGIDGSLDYDVSMKVDAGKVGSTINQALGAITGNNTAQGSKLLVKFNVGGDYNSPDIKLQGASPVGSGSTPEQVVDNSVEQAKEDIKEEVTSEVEEKKAEAAKVIEEKKEQAVEEATEKVKSKFKGLFGGGEDDG
ncbi:AsmA-like C-terminal region-containing protein [Roseivirga sp. BDSF3-8]|uniref:AsmA-like C-terminal region-containing protein n=1 Tax=Roseivirga sp. BDSF3-8 TaxID=3241598 RepID=UPI003531CF0F